MFAEIQFDTDWFAMLTTGQFKVKSIDVCGTIAEEAPSA